MTAIIALITAKNNRFAITKGDAKSRLSDTTRLQETWNELALDYTTKATNLLPAIPNPTINAGLGECEGAGPGWAYGGVGGKAGRFGWRDSVVECVELAPALEMNCAEKRERY
jgi:hypothetical protein